MASKITPQKLIDQQFIAEQFNAVVDFLQFLQNIIDNQEALLAARLGDPLFNSATTVILSQVTRTSLCLCSAELLSLRINRLSGNVDSDTAILIRTLQSAKSDYLKEADSKIDRLISTGTAADSTNYSGGSVITSRDDEELVPLWPVS